LLTARDIQELYSPNQQRTPIQIQPHTNESNQPQPRFWSWLQSKHVRINCSPNITATATPGYRLARRTRLSQAQPADRGRASLRLSGRHRAQAHLGWRGAQRVAAGGDRGERRGLSGILGICEGAKEDKAGWSGFLKHLKERGLSGVRLIISDACLGLAESAAEFFPPRPPGNAASWGR
jgi:Transposase, Mutator family